MAITLTVSNKFKYEMGIESVDLSSDTVKVILMESGFVYDKDADGTYANVSADEITSAGGYTVGGEALTVDSAWAQDNTNDRAAITWVDKTFTASGAAFDTFCAAILVLTVDATTDTTDVVIGCIEFGQDISVADGASFQLQDMGYNKD